MANAGNDEAAKHRHALTALRHRDFRLIWVGQLVSTIGDQMQIVAIAWHLFILTDSTFTVGLASLIGLIPFLVLSLAGGAVADRFDRKRVLLFAQALMMLIAGVLIVASVTDTASPGLIYGVSFVMGFARAFDAPARQAIVPNLVPPEELTNALTLNTMFRQVATIVGPGLGGLILGVFGLATTYALNFVSFLAIIAALLAMRPIPAPPRRSESGWSLALGGLRFVRREPVVLSLLGLDLLATVLGNIRALFPVFARDILKIGAEGLGLLYAAPAAGAVVGTLILGATGGRWRGAFVILAATAAYALCTLGFGLSRYLPLSLVLLFGIGLADVFGEVIRSTIVQLRTPDAVRGRVTAIWVVATNGGPQLGQLRAGAMGSLIGPAEAAVLAGAAVLLSVCAFTLNPVMRKPADELAPASVPS